MIIQDYILILISCLLVEILFIFASKWNVIKNNLNHDVEQNTTIHSYLKIKIAEKPSNALNMQTIHFF